MLSKIEILRNQLNNPLNCHVSQGGVVFDFATKMHSGTLTDLGSDVAEVTAPNSAKRYFDIAHIVEIKIR